MRRRLQNRRSRLRPQELGSIGSHQNGRTHGAGMQDPGPAFGHTRHRARLRQSRQAGVERGQTARATARGMPLPFAGSEPGYTHIWGALEFHNPLGLKLLPVGPSFGENVLFQHTSGPEGTGGATEGESGRWKKESLYVQGARRTQLEQVQSRGPVTPRPRDRQHTAVIRGRHTHDPEPNPDAGPYGRTSFCLRLRWEPRKKQSQTAEQRAQSPALCGARPGTGSPGHRAGASPKAQRCQLSPPGSLPLRPQSATALPGRESIASEDSFLADGLWVG